MFLSYSIIFYFDRFGGFVMKSNLIRIALAIVICICTVLTLASCKLIKELIGDSEDSCIHDDLDGDGKCDECGNHVHESG